MTGRVSIYNFRNTPESTRHFRSPEYSSPIFCWIRSWDSPRFAFFNTTDRYYWTHLIEMPLANRSEFESRVNRSEIFINTQYKRYSRQKKAARLFRHSITCQIIPKIGNFSLRGISFCIQYFFATDPRRTEQTRAISKTHRIGPVLPAQSLEACHLL